MAVVFNCTLLDVNPYRVKGYDSAKYFVILYHFLGFAIPSRWAGRYNDGEGAGAGAAEE